MKRVNNSEIYLVADTEAQNRWDDSKLSDYVNVKLKKEKALLENQVKLVNTVKEKLEIKNRLTVLKHEIENKSMRLCSEVNTYLLGWCDLQWKNKYNEMLSSGKTMEEVQDAFVKSKVKWYFEPNYQVSPWSRMLDDLCKKYRKKIKIGGTHRLIIYFHNLDYDAQHFLQCAVDQSLDYQVSNIELIRNGTLYSVSFEYNGCVFELRDSMKIYNQSLASLGKNVGWSKKTEKATYEWFKLDENSQRFQDELYYFKYDIAVLAAVMRTHFKKFHMKHAKLTAAGYAEKDLKHEVYCFDRKHGTDNYSSLFRCNFSDEQASFLRSAYFGGFVYANRNLLNKKVVRGIVGDVNSLYPSVMLNRNYPKWDSVRNMPENEFKQLDLHDLNIFCVVRILVTQLEIKPNGVPCIPKKSAFGMSREIYNLHDLGDDGVLTLTNIDLYWIQQNYKIKFKYIVGIRATQMIAKPFESFILKHKKAKEEAVAKHNKVDKQIAKIHLNSTYGKFAQRSIMTKEVPVKKVDGSIGFIEVADPDAKRKQRNILIAVFITAFARDVLLSAIETIKHDSRATLWYCDTDAVHFGYTGKLDPIKQAPEIFKEIKIPYSTNVFGKWKPEQHMTYARYLGSKRYWEQDPLAGPVIKGAGIQAKYGKKYLINQGFDKFKYNPQIPLIVPFKVSQKVIGGVKIFNSIKVIAPTEYQFRFMEDYKYLD